MIGYREIDDIVRKGSSDAKQNPRVSGGDALVVVRADMTMGRGMKTDGPSKNVAQQARRTLCR